MTHGDVTTEINFKSLSYFILPILKFSQLSPCTYCLRLGHKQKSGFLKETIN